MKFNSFVTGTATLAAVLAVVVSCNSTGEGPSSPSPSSPPVVATQTTTAPAAVVGTPQEVKAPDVVDGSIVNIDAQGNVTIYAPREWTACVYTYTEFLKQTFSHGFAVREGFNAFQSGPICGQTYVQVDVQAGVVDTCPADPFAGPFSGFKKGRANILVTAAKPCNTCVESETIKTEVTYSIWSECVKGQDGKCSRERTKTTTTTTTYAECQKKAPKVEVVIAKETEACECSCVEGEDPVEATGPAVWDPVILPNACNPEVLPLNYVAQSTAVALCHQIGTQPTKIDYECKSDDIGTRNLCKNVACACIPTWTEVQPPTYGPWGECKEQSHDVSRSCNSKCHQYREVTVYEKNSCTNESRVKRIYKESRDCACPVDPCVSTPASSTAAQGFDLGNANPTTETAWADLNVKLGPWTFVDKDEYSNDEYSNGKCKTADINGANTAKIALVKAGQTYRYYLNVKDGDNLCSLNSDKDISHITYFNCR